jgi:hypothetical protein
MAIMFLSDKEEPSATTRSTDKADPMREKLLKATDEPSKEKSTTAKADPSFAEETTDKRDPIREKERKDRDAPRLKKSQTARVAPIRM